MKKINTFEEHRINMEMDRKTKTVDELRITNRKMNSISLAAHIRKLGAEIKRSKDTNMKLDLLAELVLYSLQLVDMEHGSIYNKCDGSKVAFKK